MIKNNFKLFIFSLLAISLFTQCDATKKATGDNGKKSNSKNVVLTTILTDGKNVDLLGLYSFDGIGFEEVQKIAALGKDTFQFTIPKADPTFYYVGTKNKQKKPVLLGKESNPILHANVNNMYKGKVSNSPMNEKYDAMMAEVRKLQNEMNTLYRDYSKNQAKKEVATEIVGKMKKIDDQKMKLLNDYKKSNPFLANVASLFTFLSYHNNPLGHENELDHFTNEYFKEVNFADKSFNRIPAIFEGFKTYASTLTKVRIEDKKVIEHLETMLGTWEKGSNAYRFAMGGSIVALQGAKHAAFPYFVEKYLAEFGTESESSKRLQSQMTSEMKLVKGALAPDFVQNDPDGKQVNLSDFKGKYLLVDFWASWCGPCRKENPHVLKLYNKYHDMGFDVLGVSLDKKMDPWLKAIEKDKLVWNHVSDLKGWGNEVAGMYGVKSIPHTVLLDKEGRIIARNLRSNTLAVELKKIFGK